MAIVAADDDLTNREFNDWTVIGFSEHRKHVRYWKCRCRCGTVKLVEANSLKKGTSKSCGCRPNKGHRTHGMRKSPEYSAWISMRRRCYDESSGSYERYGAVGVTVCDRWRDSFENFFADLGPKPTKAHQLDRIKGHVGYEPGNCRWATRVEQAVNRKSTRMITHGGVTLCLKHWCQRLGLNRKTVTSRLRSGWSELQALGLSP